MPSSAPPAPSTLSLHDALPISVATCAFVVSIESTAGTRFATCWMTGTARRICSSGGTGRDPGRVDSPPTSMRAAPAFAIVTACARSEEHTSELQSPCNLVCRLLRPPRPPLFPYTTLFRSPWQLVHLSCRSRAPLAPDSLPVG